MVLNSALQHCMFEFLGPSPYPPSFRPCPSFRPVRASTPRCGRPLHYSSAPSLFFTRNLLAYSHAYVLATCDDVDTRDLRVETRTGKSGAGIRSDLTIDGVRGACGVSTASGAVRPQGCGLTCVACGCKRGFGRGYCTIHLWIVLEVRCTCVCVRLYVVLQFWILDLILNTRVSTSYGFPSLSVVLKILLKRRYGTSKGLGPS